MGEGVTWSLCLFSNNSNYFHPHIRVDCLGARKPKPHKPPEGSIIEIRTECSFGPVFKLTRVTFGNITWNSRSINTSSFLQEIGGTRNGFIVHACAKLPFGRWKSQWQQNSQDYNNHDCGDFRDSKPILNFTVFPYIEEVENHYRDIEYCHPKGSISLILNP